MTRATSVAYTGCFVVGTLLSMRRGHKAAALGIRTPLSVPVDVVLGIGTALAAPWPLILGLWRAHGSAGSGGLEADRGKALVAFSSTMFLAGSVAEPISHRLLARELPYDEAILATLNLCLPVTMLAGSLASLVTERTDEPCATGNGLPIA